MIHIYVLSLQMVVCWELLFVGADTALVYLFHTLYKSETKAADAVKVQCLTMSTTVSYHYHCT